MSHDGYKGATLITNTIGIVCDDYYNQVFLCRIELSENPREPPRMITMQAIAGKKKGGTVKDSDDGLQATFDQCIAPTYDALRNVLYVADKAASTIRVINCAPDAQGNYNYPVTTLIDFSKAAPPIETHISYLYLTLDGRSLYAVDQSEAGRIVRIDVGKQDGQNLYEEVWSASDTPALTAGHGGTPYFISSWANPQRAAAVGACPEDQETGSDLRPNYRVTDPVSRTTVYVTDRLFWVSDKGGSKKSGPIYLFDTTSDSLTCAIWMEDASNEDGEWVAQSMQQIAGNIALAMNRNESATGVWKYLNPCTAPSQDGDDGPVCWYRYPCGNFDKNSVAGSATKLVQGRDYEAPHGLAIAPSRSAALLADTAWSGGGTLWYIWWSVDKDASGEPTDLSQAGECRLDVVTSEDPHFSAEIWGNVLAVDDQGVNLNAPIVAKLPD